MPLPRPREDEDAEDWLKPSLAGGFGAPGEAWPGVLFAPPSAADRLVVDAPWAFLAGTPGAPDPAPPAFAAPPPPDAARPVTHQEGLPAPRTGAAEIGQDGPGNGLPSSSAVPCPDEAAAGSPSAGRGAADSPEAAPWGADPPTSAPGAAEAAGLPAACNAAAASPGAGQNGPGSAPPPSSDPEEGGWDLLVLPSAPGEAGAGLGPPHDPPGGGRGGLPPGLAARIAALLDAESRAAEAWLDDFLAGRVEAGSVFDPGFPRGGASEGHGWPFG